MKLTASVGANRPMACSLAPIGAAYRSSTVRSSSHLASKATGVWKNSSIAYSNCRGASTAWRTAAVRSITAPVSNHSSIRLGSSPVQQSPLQGSKQQTPLQLAQNVLEYLRQQLQHERAQVATAGQTSSDSAAVQQLLAAIQQQSTLVQLLQQQHVPVSSNIVPAAALAAASVPVSKASAVQDVLLNSCSTSSSSSSLDVDTVADSMTTAVSNSNVEATAAAGSVHSSSSSGASVKNSWCVVPSSIETAADTLAALISSSTSSTTAQLSTVWMAAAAAKGQRPYMEDRHHHCYLDLPTPVAYAGLFDGHGGHMTADHAAQHMHKVLHNSLARMTTAKSSSSYNQYEPVLSSAFQRFDKDWHEATSGRSYDQSGSTAVVALVNKKSLVVANTGDSVAVLARRGSAVRLSELHKPDSEAEAARVTAAGGVVFKNSDRGSLRVRQHRTTLPAGERYAKQPSVAVTRALGDYKLKRRQYPILVAQPYVSELALSPADSLLLLTSDGVTDVLTDQQMMEVALEAVKHKARTTAESGQDLAQAAAAAVTQAALDRGAWDNVTALAVMLDWGL